jgi:hypothetical protein
MWMSLISIAAMTCTMCAAGRRVLGNLGNDGMPLAVPGLDIAAAAALRLGEAPRLIGLRDADRANLAWHRENIFRKGT